MKTITTGRIYKRWCTTIATTIVIASTIIIPGLAQAVTDNTTMTTDMAAHKNDVVVNPQRDAVAIRGYDPVAYFTELKAVKGSDEFSHKWLGDKWLFKNEKNKQLFISDAMGYMPNYGGYCSFDPVSAGHGHDIDPTAWRIVNNKLYLFYSEEIAGENMDATEWQKVKAGLAAE
jgi:hypothetical protein